MPVNILENPPTDNYMQRLRFIQEAISKVATSHLSDIPQINIIGEVENDKSNFHMQSNSTHSNGLSIPMNVLDSEKEEPKRVFAASILDSKIRKIRLKRYSDEAEKLSKNIPIAKLDETNIILDKVDSKNCEWNLLSKRAQRSAVIKYCNELKFYKGELIKIDKKVLTELKSTLWEFIKSNPEYPIDYSEDEEMIVNIEFLKVSSYNFQIVNSIGEVIKEFNITNESDTNLQKKKKIKLKINTSVESVLKKDDD